MVTLKLQRGREVASRRPHASEIVGASPTPATTIKDMIMPPAKKEEILRFQEAIENIVEKNQIGYIEAITLFCEEHDFEIESVPRFLSQRIREEVQREAENLSLLKEKPNRLPI
jgi:hypothetical protein